MKVRMKVEVSGTRNGQPWPPRGSVIDMPDVEAASYCSSGMAEPVTVVDPEPEKAVAVDDSEKRTPAAEPTPADVRAWAKDQGVDVAAKGVIPNDVLEQYKAARA